MKLSGYGCSFVYGIDLSSSLATWPAIMAREIGYEYRCRALPGSGNLQIMEQILRSAQDDDISIINWTWIDRFDFVDCNTEQWNTLRPALDHLHAEYYFKNLHSQYRDILTNLVYINVALDFLISNNKRFIMTYMDSLIMEDVLPSWHDPAPIMYLQQKILPYLNSFNGMSFLEWSRFNRFDISESWHPLDEAHCAAAEYFKNQIKNLSQ